MDTETISPDLLRRIHALRDRQPEPAYAATWEELIALLRAGHRLPALDFGQCLVVYDRDPAEAEVWHLQTSDTESVCAGIAPCIQIVRCGRWTAGGELEAYCARREPRAA
jgi:hypothetical protein